MTLSRRLISEITSRECNEYQIQGGDIMLIPVGSVEALAPHLPIGARTFVVQAFCQLMAERVEGLYLPTTSFSSVPHTFRHPGSIDIPENALNTYIRALMDDLHATGFRRILLVTYLDYLRYYIPQEFYEDHQVAAAGIHLGEELPSALRELGVGEDSCVLGALHLIGHDDLAEKIIKENERLLTIGYEQSPLPAELLAMRKVGSVGFSYPKNSFPIAPNANLSVEKGEQALRQVVERMAPAVESLRTYNEFLGKRGVSRGMMWRGWR